MNQTKINRRNAIKRTTYIMGSTLMTPTILGLLNGCSAKPQLTWIPTFFTEDQAILVTKIADIILPKTDTPSASELGVPKFIEDILNMTYEEGDKLKFIELMTQFDQDCMKEKKEMFIKLEKKEQEGYALMQNEKLKDEMNIRPSPGSGKIYRSFMWQIKELTIAGYLTTEIGATQLLQYSMIPGPYQGCVPLSEAGNGKAWAT